MAKEKGFLGEWDEDRECHVLEEEPLLDEVRESYARERVHELKSDSDGDREENVRRIKAWIAQWAADNEAKKNRTVEDDDEDDD